MLGVTFKDPLWWSLQMLRVSGFAPFTTKRGFQVSTILTVYGWLLNLTISVRILFFSTVPRHSLYLASYGSKVCLIMIILSTTFQAGFRLNALRRCLSTLQEIHLKVGQSNIDKRDIRSRLLLLFVWFTLVTSIYLKFSTVYKIGVFQNAIYLVELCLAHFISLELHCVLQNFYSRLVEIYKYIMTELKTENNVNDDALEMTPECKVRLISVSYLKIADTFRLIDKMYSTVMPSIVCLTVFEMINNTKIISSVSSVDDAFFISLIIIGTVWSNFFNFNIFHKINMKVNQIIKDLNEIEYYVQDERLISELELFKKIVALNSLKFSPLGLFTITREFVIQIFSCAFTILVILYTLDDDDS
ncbi:uncharacterized protein LOC121727978 [Aricia agestis]|uniref:uncharacterized protein LOC121727978 n=1 Tax=Aricia agestis TaxID=91739 RepID=UPI001C208A8D|nr:uncharacterized protein LOC121727978 [Aricia agestis]